MWASGNILDADKSPASGLYFLAILAPGSQNPLDNLGGGGEYQWDGPPRRKHQQLGRLGTSPGQSK